MANTTETVLEVIIESLINGQFAQAKEQFQESDIELAHLYGTASRSYDKTLPSKVLRMADSCIDRHYGL
jgi:hypothetical protein